MLSFHREAEPQVLDAGTPPPITAALSFLDAEEQPLQKASIGDPIKLVVHSEQAGPHNMMLTECTATRVGGEGEAVPFTIIESGLVRITLKPWKWKSQMPTLSCACWPGGARL